MTEELTGSRRSSHSTLRGSPFPPIAEYGFLSDCEVSALIAAGGAVEWMCLPRMDGPSVFITDLAVRHLIRADEQLSAEAMALIRIWR